MFGDHARLAHSLAGAGKQSETAINAATTIFVLDGCFNARDLSGLTTPSGLVIRPGTLIRSESLERLTAAGRRTLRERGIASVIDLRDPREIERAVHLLGQDYVNVPVLDFDDREFWRQWRDRPPSVEYYRAWLERWPCTFTRAVRRIACARPGGVLVHCRLGRDRTGVVIALVLGVCGVSISDIADDYGLSALRLAALYDTLLSETRSPERRAEILRERDCENLSMPAIVEELLAGMDISEFLLNNGMTRLKIQAIQLRLLGDAPSPASGGEVAIVDDPAELLLGDDDARHR